MVDGVGKGGALAREALLAAMKRQAERSDEVRGEATSLGSEAISGELEKPGFGDQLTDQIEALNKEIQGVDDIPKDLLTGKIEDFHEVTVQIKKAEFSFRFAMEMRNKLLDAYREVMRMTV